MWRLLASVGLVLASSCADTPESGPGLALTAFRQAGQAGVLLNEPLVLHFSDDLDASSVTRASARVVDAEGRSVAGRFEVHGEQLRFHPRLPLRADLSDGGFRPGETIEVQLLGFPSPSGLRSRGGVLLASTYRSSFQVAEPKHTSFLDESPDGAAPLVLEAAEIGTADPMVLTCTEPLDPRSISSESFELKRFRDGPGPNDEPDGWFEPVILDAVLIENRSAGARIELRAMDRIDDTWAPRSLEPGEYHLWVHDGAAAPLDLGGHPVPSAWALSQLPTSLNVVVRADQGGTRVHREEFLSRALRSPAEVPGLDGTATWAGDGVVRLRLPRAAHHLPAWLLARLVQVQGPRMA